MNEHRDSRQRLYAILGVDTDATDAEIATVYRRLAREHRPDIDPAGNTGAVSEVTDAYGVLPDAARRSAYNATRYACGRAAAAAAGVRILVRHVAQPTAAPPSRRPARPQASDVDLPLTFYQPALGARIVVAVDSAASCRAHGGTGHSAASATIYDPCRGKGTTTRNSGGMTIRTECSRYAGTGRLFPTACPACGGTGTCHRTHDVTVRVPAGVDTGSRLRIPVPPTSQRSRSDRGRRPAGRSALARGGNARVHRGVGPPDILAATNGSDSSMTAPARPLDTLRAHRANLDALATHS